MNDATKRYFATKDFTSKGRRGKMKPKHWMTRNCGQYIIKLATSASGGPGSMKLELLETQSGDVVAVKRCAVESRIEAEAEFYAAYRLVAQ